METNTDFFFVSHALGPVPDALASLLVKGEEQEEAKHYPNKRRRLSKKHSTVIKPNSSSGTTLPDGYIPLARFTLDLVSIDSVNYAYYNTGYMTDFCSYY